MPLASASSARVSSACWRNPRSRGPRSRSASVDVHATQFAKSARADCHRTSAMTHPGAMTTNWDVVVVGGGAAGLSAAVMLGRSRRSVVVIDAGDPRNAPAEHMHGFLGHDGLGAPGAPDARPGRGRALRRHDPARRGGGPDAGPATTSPSRPPTARTCTPAGVLVTTGLTDELPDVPGLRERWGRDVLHCPYCHGWEVRTSRSPCSAPAPGRCTRPSCSASCPTT